MIRFLKRAAVVLVCAVTFSQTPMHVYAEAFREKYISDVDVVCGLDEEQAREEFEKKGYKILPTNVNATLETPVYIGYRTTYNIDDAIRGLSFMNMRGKYSFSDYEQLIESNREMIDQKIDGLSAAIELFRTNYDEGQESAVRAYELMNRIEEDYSDQGMGDFLMNCSLENGNRAELVDVIMKGNNQIMTSIIQLLDMAAITEETSWLNRLEESPYDTLLEEYMQIYPSASKAQKALSQAFDAGALQLYNQWDELYDALQLVENEVPKDEVNGYDIESTTKADTSDLPEPESEEMAEAQKARIEMIEADAKIEATKAVSLYELLKVCPYGEGTMLDYFNRPKSDITLEELYPLVQVLGDAHIATLNETGLVNMLLNAMKADDWEDSAVQAFDEMMEGMEDISLYMGTDQRKFQGGIALTSAASQIEFSSGKSWWLSSMQGLIDPGAYDADRWGSVALLGIGIGACVVTGIAILFTQRLIVRTDQWFRGYRDNVFNDFFGLVESVQEKTEYIYNNPYGFGSPVNPAFRTPWGFIYNKWTQGNLHNGFVRYLMLANVVFLAASFITFLVLTVWEIVQVFRAVFTPDSYAYEDMPMLICDGYHGEDFQDYVLYDLVTCINGTNQFGDMNGYDEEKNPNGWLCLYYTKDSRAGAPLTTLSIRTGSDKAGIKEEGVAMFGEANALNVTDQSYTNKEDTTGGTYLFYKRAAGAQTTGSAMSTGTLAVIGGSSFLLGGILGFALRRRSRKETAAA